MRRFALAACLVLLLPFSADAQDDGTLADIRQELTVLYVEMQRLKRELSTTGAASVVVGGDTVLDRVAAMEAELQRLTSKTEALELRVNRIVQDGTNRIGDLEFRLVELEGGDVSTLGETTTLGGDTGDSAAAANPTPPPAAADTTGAAALPGGIELAVGEQDDFRRAHTALSEGRYQEAADQFTAFAQTYPGGPLAPGAALGRGDALDNLGDTNGAARAYLESFSADPQGPLAPEALYRLGKSLGVLDQTAEACVTLSEVAIRFPGDPAVARAEEAKRALACQ
jgi:tol-pal system protein YbgF